MQDKWDAYFLRIATEVGSNSKCLSRQIGAILVRDKSIISTGYNGPARGIPHCGERNVFNQTTDKTFTMFGKEYPVPKHEKVCPRKALGYKSGEGLHLCPAVHAEVNTITNAARLGVSTVGSIMYLSGGVMPCVHCMSAIINASIVEVVVAELTFYDDSSKFIIQNTDVVIRDYKGTFL